MTVLRAEVFDGCPMDPRFLGWGGEDAAWGQALRRLYGPPAQFDGALTHLWHVHQVARIVGGTIYKPELPAASDLLIRYGRAYAEGEPAMRALVDEARATLAAL